MKRPYKITLSAIAGLLLLFVILASIFLYQHRYVKAGQWINIGGKAGD